MRAIGRKPRSIGGKKGKAQREKQRNKIRPWRPLYHTRRWQALRKVILKRDGYTCQRTGTLLIGEDPEPNSPVVNHKIPAHEFWWDNRRELFWDPENLEAVSKQEHDTRIQAEEWATRHGKRR